MIMSTSQMTYLVIKEGRVSRLETTFTFERSSHVVCLPRVVPSWLRSVHFGWLAASEHADSRPRSGSCGVITSRTRRLDGLVGGGGWEEGGQ
jgi:hypothetical protein